MSTGSNTCSWMSSRPVFYPPSAIGILGFTCRYLLGLTVIVFNLWKKCCYLMITDVLEINGENISKSVFYLKKVF